MSETYSLKGQALKLDTAADLKAHVKALEENTNVESIHLEGNTIGVEASQALADILETKTSLRYANLADIFTGRLLAEIPQALDALLKALLKCPNLQTINLNDNAFGLNTVEPLRSFLSQHTPLRHLYLNNNGLGPAAGALIAEALTQLSESKEAARKEGKDVPYLETVVCGRNRLENGSMAAWVKAYSANNQVKTVKMVQNGIRQEGIATLLQHGLSNCDKLQVLDLQDNTFTALAAKTLSNVTPKWVDLLDLGVGDCLLSARGGRMLGEALVKGENKKLEVLRLQYNEIDGKGVQALATAVEGSGVPRLRRMELNGNRFSEEDANIAKIQSTLSKRKEEQAEEYPDVDEDDEDAWGLDELDELEDDDDDDEEEDDEDGEVEDEEEKILKDADAAESQPVAQEKDKEVDELADALGKTEIK